MTSISDIETSAAATQPEQAVQIIPVHDLIIQGVSECTIDKRELLSTLTAMQLSTFIAQHKQNAEKDHMRLGQRFCNMYVKESEPTIYYEADDAKAEQLIAEWLAAHSYDFDWPPLVERVNVLA